MVWLRAVERSYIMRCWGKEVGTQRNELLWSSHYTTSTV